jgi:hypothetical protein
LNDVDGYKYSIWLKCKLAKQITEIIKHLILNATFLARLNIYIHQHHSSIYIVIRRYNILYYTTITFYIYLRLFLASVDVVYSILLDHIIVTLALFPQSKMKSKHIPRMWIQARIQCRCTLNM